jgi:hypothetical protein
MQEIGAQRCHFARHSIFVCALGGHKCSESLMFFAFVIEFGLKCN